MTTNQLFLVRPQRHPHERVDDYLKRLAKLNGFSSGRVLNGILIKWAQSNGIDIIGSTRIDSICQILEVLLNRKFKVHLFDKPVFIKKNSELKICRICASKAEVVMFYWYLEGYRFCHLHNEPMLSEQEDVEFDSEKPIGNRFHPVVNFLDRDDPWLEYGMMLKSRSELRWLCVAMSDFFKNKLATRVSAEGALACIEQDETARLSITGRLDVVTTLIALQSNVPVDDVCVVSALLLWRRMRPDYVANSPGQMSSEATSESLEWATHKLLGYGPMLSFLSEMYSDANSTECKRLNQFIPLFANLDQQEDSALRKVISFSGIANELVCAIPSGRTSNAAYRCEKTAEEPDTVPLDA